MVTWATTGRFRAGRNTIASLSAPAASTRATTFSAEPLDASNSWSQPTYRSSTGLLGGTDAVENNGSLARSSASNSWAGTPSASKRTGYVGSTSVT
jgi:hypothetical protein